MNFVQRLKLYLSLILPLLSFCKPAIVLSIVVCLFEGPNKEIISPCFSMTKFTLFTLFFSLAVKLPFLISKNYWTLIDYINFFF